jgi:hypothetical protein
VGTANKAMVGLSVIFLADIPYFGKKQRKA